MEWRLSFVTCAGLSGEHVLAASAQRVPGLREHLVEGSLWATFVYQRRIAVAGISRVYRVISSLSQERFCQEVADGMRHQNLPPVLETRSEGEGEREGECGGGRSEGA